MNKNNGSGVSAPKIYFIHKEDAQNKGKTIESFDWPFSALTAFPSVGDLVTLEGTKYRIYLRNYDYTSMTDIIIYLYMIRVDDD